MAALFGGVSTIVWKSGAFEAGGRWRWRRAWNQAKQGTALSGGTAGVWSLLKRRHLGTKLQVEVQK